MDIKPKWFIEDFLDNLDNLKNSLKKYDTEYVLTSEIRADSKFLNTFPENDCVVYYGSLETGFYLRKNAKWIPGVYTTIENYACNRYYPVFNKYLLNHNYIMIPYGELLRQKQFLFDSVGEDDSLFIRPNSGNKIFTGKLVYKDRFEKDIKLFGFYQVENHELCVVSQPRNIINEWRFFVSDCKIVAGSLYSSGEKFCGVERRVNQDVFETDRNDVIEFAEKIANECVYNPDKIWSLDICETKANNLYVLEIGCFSSAGLYGCNTDSIVEHVNKISIEEWLEYND